MNRISWKEVIVGTLAGLSVMASPAVGKMSGPTEGSEMRLENRGHGSLNSGPRSMNRGRGSMNSGRDGESSGTRHGRDHTVVAQVEDVRPLRGQTSEQKRRPPRRSSDGPSRGSQRR